MNNLSAILGQQPAECRKAYPCGCELVITFKSVNERGEITDTRSPGWMNVDTRMCKLHDNAQALLDVAKIALMRIELDDDDCTTMEGDAIRAVLVSIERKK